MNPSHPSKRRRREVSLAAETLETRELLTGGAGSTFAILPGQITASDQPTVIKFTIDPSHFTVPKRGRFTLGIDVAADSTNTTTGTAPALAPLIVGVQSADGRAVMGTNHALYAPNVRSSGKVSSPMTTAVTLPVSLSGKKHDGPITYSVVIAGNTGATGKFLLGFYLPGDANGDGAVNQADLSAVKAELGVNSSSSKYTFDADPNRDGRITQNDLAMVRKNMGVKTTISPSVSAVLDPASDTGVQDRETTLPTVHFSGQATPGATVTYTEVNSLVAPVTTTADAAGNYSLVTPLGSGSNTFRVTTVDAFGQSISGTIAPVTLLTSAPVTASSVAALKQQASGTVPGA
jgi:hypothetical protein